MRERLKTFAASATGMLAAFLGSLCCAGPLMFALVGIGVGAGLAARFEPLRPLFGVIMLASFALAFRRIYFPSRGAMAEGDVQRDALRAIAPGDPPMACAVPPSRRRAAVLFCSSAVIALVMWTFPSWSRLFV